MHTIHRLSPLSAVFRVLVALSFTGLMSFAGSLSLRAADSPAKASATEADGTQRTYSLPAGNAGDVLKLFSQQSGKGVIANGDAVKGIKTNSVQGDFTATEALKLLLADTGLVATQDAKTGAFAVRRGESDPNAARAALQGLDRPGSPALNTEDGMVQMGTFEVLGSKLINADLPRTRDDVQPYVVFNREQLESSQATNLDEFFRGRLPMNQASFLTGVSANFSGINLRGLGFNQTLILLDGRRLPPQAGSRGSTSAADINGIPLSMIERIEILPSTASGIYGGGATGGVINIITRKDYAGVEIAASYLNTFDTDASTRRVELNASLQLEGGRTMVTVNASVVDGTSLLAQDRDLVQRGQALQLANNPASFYGSATPPAGYTTNIRSQSGANLVLKPQFGGANLGSPLTFVPMGYTGIASDNAAALVANAGKYNLDMPNVVNGRLATLRIVPRQESYGFSVRRKFGARVELLADASHFLNRAENVLFGNNTASFTLSATAPNNPFTAPVNVSFPATFLERAGNVIGTNLSKVNRLLAGIVVRFPADWTVGADYVWSRSQTFSASPFGLLGDPDGTGPGLSFSTALSTGVLDVVRDLNRFPLDYGPHKMPSPLISSDFILEANEVTLRGSGPLFSLPAGMAALSVSAQFRDERIPGAISSASSTASPTLTYTWNPAVELQARAYYAELQLPVFGSTGPSAWRRHLDFQLAVRRDESHARTRANLTPLTNTSPEGPFPPVAYVEPKWSATKATAGFKYAPLPDVALRASWGSGFLVPGLDQLGFQGPTISGFLITDPKRGNQRQALLLTGFTGGRPDMQPEESESLSAGVVLTPRFLPGFRLSLDYTRIEKANEIGPLTTDLLFAYEDRLPGLIVRAPLTPADQALGYTGGAIQQIDRRSINVAEKRLTAYDLQADYTRRVAGWGEFEAYAAATYQPDYSTKPFPDVAFLQTAGTASIVKWRGNCGLTWTRGRLSLGWNMQYYGSYLVYTPGSAATTIAAQILSQGSDTIPSQNYHDLLATYRWGAQPAGWQRFLANTQLSVGVQNFLNTRPPVLATTSIGPGGYSALGDARLARYTITVRRKF